MNLKKRYLYLLYFVLAVSIIGNIMTLSLDVVPTIYPKVKDKYFREETLHKVDSTTENIVYQAALNMAGSSEVAMVWNEHQGMTNSLLSLKSTRHSTEFKKFNFPRAFLLWSISNYLTNQRLSNKQLSEIKILCDDYINIEGQPKFTLNRIDQIPFGLVALNLYRHSEENKYLNFSH